LSAEQASHDPGPKPLMKWLPIEKLLVDKRYQRDLVSKRIQKMLTRFNWRDFQPVTVAEVEEGRYAVLDGQHRVKAAELHPEIKEVPCYIVEAPELKNQAQTFVTINRERAAVRPVDIYFAGIAAGDEEALKIESMLNGLGIRVWQGASGSFPPKTTGAIGAIRRGLASYGEWATREALRIITEVHPETYGALRGAYIIAFASFCNKYKDTVDSKVLEDAIRSLNLYTLSADARSIKEFSGGTVESAMRGAVLQAYNKRAKEFGKKKLKEE